MTSLRTRSAYWRFAIVFLFFSSTALSISFGKLFGGRKVDRARIDDGKQKLLRPPPSYDPSNDGLVQVQEALSLLGTINTSTGSVKVDKKAGIVGATVYYAKEAFVLLFMNGPKQNTLNTGEPVVQLTKPLSTAVRLLEDVASKQENPDAIYLLAELNFWGNFSHPRNYKQAFRRYQQLSELTGNATAQSMLGFFYATGLGNVVARDQAKAQLYHTFAAEQGNIRSEMTLAFRASSGIGTRKDCDVATEYYKRVADKAIAFSRAGPPGGQVLPRDAYRLADEVGGVYGKGASHSTQQKDKMFAPRQDSDENVIEYLDLLSRTGDPKATFNLGRLNYDGNRGLKRNFRRARLYFTNVVRKYWDENDRVIVNADNSLAAADLAKSASKAAAYIGRMHLRGEGLPQNFREAQRWFKLGLKTGNPFCQYELGLMHLLGLGVRKDAVAAAELFKAAASQDWPAAQARLGRLFLDQGDLNTAEKYFKYAWAHGHIEGMYYLGEIYNLWLEGRERNCALAQSFYKIVSEKAEPLHSAFDEANRMYEDGDTEGAIVRYMMAAEQGYESAQANVAWLLDDQKSVVDFSSLIPWNTAPVHAPSSPAASILKNAALALIYWTRSAKQWNADSAVKMGDAYFSGLGTSKPDVEKAVACYQNAADSFGSAQALWNLGWMHENGIGAEQDFHLAKRNYDLALESGDASYLPVKLALWKLRIRSRWNDWVGGGVKSMEYGSEEANEPRYKTWSEWLANFLEDEHPYYQQPGDYPEQWMGEGEDAYPRDWDDGTGGIGSDDYYIDEIDEGVLETLFIMSLVVLLSWLVWYRQQRQQAQGQQQGEHNAVNGNAQQQQPVQQANGAFLQRPNDPNFNAWGAGGVGH